MRRLFVFCVGLVCVIENYETFNIETEKPKVFEHEEQTFGYRVTEFESGKKWIIVSAPLALNQTGTPTGRLYRCLYDSKSCYTLAVKSPPEAGAISLGMSLDASQSENPRILGCGPTLSHPCGSNLYQNGICFLFDAQFRHVARFPAKTQDCFTARVDLAFLIDGSTSINPDDFSRMKEFLIAMLRRFKHRDVQFAVMQFSHLIKKEFTFLDYRLENRSENLVVRIRQIHGDTYTPTAIKRIVQDLFEEETGLRSDSARVLVVITDGTSNDPNTGFNEAIAGAESKGVFRLVVGVGPVFQSAEGQRELLIIASNSSVDNVFSILNYTALVSIQERLQNKIFSIEGTQAKGDTSTFQTEMSQEGFSCSLPPDGAILGSVGAYGWSGGILVYHGGKETFLNVSQGEFKDSYLGYSVQFGTRAGKKYYIAGAPRHRHRGEVVIFRNRVHASWEVNQRIPGEQIGSQFGSELRLVDLNGDGESDLLLVGAPMFLEPGFGGIVKVYSMSPEGTLSFSVTLQGARGKGLGRFGTSIAQIRDLNGDGLVDVAIGAPLEVENSGCVYIFQGTTTSIQSKYSQRLLGAKVSPALRYFGQSISGRLDLSGDGLTDLVVGSDGVVIVFRSRPIVDLVAWFSFRPPRVPGSLYHCSRSPSTPLPCLNATLCFNLTRIVTGNLGHPRVKITYTLVLDPDRQTSRAVFQMSARSLDESVSLQGQGRCLSFPLLFPSCIQDYFDPIVISVNFTMDTEEMEGSKGLHPILNENLNTTQLGELYFERDCELGSHCPDYLKLAFNFTGGDELVIGRDALLRVRVSLENAGDDAYKVKLDFQHSEVLTFRRIVPDQTGSSLVDCGDDQNKNGEETETSTCRVSHPVFFKGSRITFEAEFDTKSPTREMRGVNFTIVTTSQSPHHIANESSFSRLISILYAVDLFVSQLNFTRHATFFAGQRETRLVRHSYQVKNSGQRTLPVMITFAVPAGTGTIPFWNISVTERSPTTASTCLPVSVTRRLEQPSSDGHPRSDLLPGCGIGLCLTVWCEVRSLQQGASLTFDVEGEVAGAAVEEVMHRDRVGLWSRVELTFDEARYADRYRGAAQYRRVLIVTDLELIPPVSRLPLIIGGVLGGLALLLLIMFALYKFGFFIRSSTQEDRSDPGGETVEGDDEPSGEGDTGAK